MNDVHCMKCGAEVPESSAYIEEGGHICQSCFTADEVEAGFSGSYKAMGVSAILLAVVSWCNPFTCFPFVGAIFPLLSVAAAIGALRYPNYLDDAEKEMLKNYEWVKIVAIVSLFISSPALIWEAYKAISVFIS